QAEDGIRDDLVTGVQTCALPIFHDGDLNGLHAVVDSERTLVVDFERELPPVRIAGARPVRVDGPRQWLAFPASASAAPLVAELEIGRASCRERVEGGGGAGEVQL